MVTHAGDDTALQMIAGANRINQKPERALNTSGKPVRAKNLLGPGSGGCPTRVLVDQLADKWAILLLLALSDGTWRFNALKREVDGITQKMLGQTLRKLERNGLIDRTALATMPMTVEYSLTATGRSLMPVVQALRTWSTDHLGAVEAARARFDAARAA